MEGKLMDLSVRSWVKVLDGVPPLYIGDIALVVRVDFGQLSIETGSTGTNAGTAVGGKFFGSDYSDFTNASTSRGFDFKSYTDSKHSEKEEEVEILRETRMVNGRICQISDRKDIQIVIALLPRINYDEKSLIANKRRRLDGHQIPQPAPFDIEKAVLAYGLDSIEVKDGITYLTKPDHNVLQFFNGLLLLYVSANHLQRFHPRGTDLKEFENMGIDITYAAYEDQRRIISNGDRVEIRSGNYVGHWGVLYDIDFANGIGKIRSLRTRENYIFPNDLDVALSALCLKFQVGDYLLVRFGVHTGRKGVVCSFSNRTACIIEDNTSCKFKIHESCLQHCNAQRESSPGSSSNPSQHELQASPIKQDHTINKVFYVAKGLFKGAKGYSRGYSNGVLLIANEVTGKMVWVRDSDAIDWETGIFANGEKPIGDISVQISNIKVSFNASPLPVSTTTSVISPTTNVSASTDLATAPVVYACKTKPESELNLTHWLNHPSIREFMKTHRIHVRFRMGSNEDRAVFTNLLTSNNSEARSSEDNVSEDESNSQVDDVSVTWTDSKGYVRTKNFPAIEFVPRKPKTKNNGILIREPHIGKEVVLIKGWKSSNELEVSEIDSGSDGKKTKRFRIRVGDICGYDSGK